MLVENVSEWLPGCIVGVLGIRLPLPGLGRNRAELVRSPQCLLLGPRAHMVYTWVVKNLNRDYTQAKLYTE